MAAVYQAILCERICLSPLWCAPTMKFMGAAVDNKTQNAFAAAAAESGVAERASNTGKLYLVYICPRCAQRVRASSVPAHCHVLLALYLRSCVKCDYEQAALISNLWHTPLIQKFTQHAGKSQKERHQNVLKSHSHNLIKTLLVAYNVIELSSCIEIIQFKFHHFCWQM
jgi:hypothetical protein